MLLGAGRRRLLAGRRRATARRRRRRRRARAADPGDHGVDVALSEPVEDRVYPDVGDPGVDALHYDLDLAWDPDPSGSTAPRP